MTTWRRMSATEWYGAGFGTVSHRADGWWGSKSTTRDVDVEPVVGPYTTAKEARYALGEAMTRRSSQPNSVAARSTDNEQEKKT